MSPSQRLALVELFHESLMQRMLLGPWWLEAFTERHTLLRVELRFALAQALEAQP